MLIYIALNFISVIIGSFNRMTFNLTAPPHFHFHPMPKSGISGVFPLFPLRLTGVMPNEHLRKLFYLSLSLTCALLNISVKQTEVMKEPLRKTA
jgi:hypothetical protein